MSGHDQFNFPLFNRAAKWLEEEWVENVDIYNPVDLDKGIPPDFPDNQVPLAHWQAYLREDVKVIADCEVIVLLPGWHTSKGAKFEMKVAQTLGLDAYILKEKGEGFEIEHLDPKDVPYLEAERVINTALGLVYGRRGDDYGHPYDNFTTIGRGWGAILGVPDIEPETVAMMCRWLKIARQVNKPVEDNLIDEVGYLVTEMRATARREGRE